MRIEFNEVRFIKLRRRGTWERDCIEGRTPSVRFGFENPHHQECLDGDWSMVEKY